MLVIVVGVSVAVAVRSSHRGASIARHAAGSEAELERAATLRAAVGARAQDRGSAVGARPVLGPRPEIKHDTSPPLKTLKPKPRRTGRKLREEREIPVPPGSGTPDPVVQTSAPSSGAPVAGASFDGVAVQDSLPPDTNGAAGATAYVQIVNQEFQVFTKSGASLYGPAPTNTLWTGFGGLCETTNDGDATVSYDRLAGRWVIQQFAFDPNTLDPPYSECIAVSKTGDPTGEWHRYEFGGFDDEFPDYPKLAVWPDAYYVTYNLFAGAMFFDGPEVCAYDRAKMLIGVAASQQCELVGDVGLGGLLPSDVDGATPPPAGSPNFVLAFDTGQLEVWKFHVDWDDPSSSTFTGPTAVPVASFAPACGGGACIPQKHSSVHLDSLGDRLMYRLAYRNFGDHESLVVTHAVTAGSAVGVRWYELRDPDGSPTVYQQGTYAPSDGQYRWMSSAAMDGSGNIALGFSVSSGNLDPGISYTGRLAGDPLGTMTQGETVLMAGLGSQTVYDRWGDYSSMSIDPSDDCTFWYTNEYLPNTGVFNWHTRIGSFTLPGCAAATVDDFSLAPSPATVTAEQGDGAGTSIVTAVTTGSAQTVALSASGMPFGTTASFGSSSVTAGDTSTLTFDVGWDTPPGTYTITVVGTGSSATHTTTVTLEVELANAVTNSDFTSGLAGWTAGGDVAPTVVTGKKVTHSMPQAVQLGATKLVPGDSTLSQSVDVPGGTSALTFWYQPHCKSKKAPDQIQAEIRTTGGATLATVLGTCTNKSKWQKASFDTSSYAGQTIVLWFNAHATGVKKKPTYLLLDDVTLGMPLGDNAVQNAGFEAGTFDSWTTGGVQAPAISSTAHKGTASARLGQTTAFDGDSTITQTVVVPGVDPTLTFWYQPHCPDTVVYDQIQMQVRDDLDQIESVVLNACTNKGKWTQVTFDMSAYAGQQVVLYFNVHDDGVAEDPTWALIDDVSLT